MKCSRCSEVVRPVVALDIDGTLARWHAMFGDFAQAWVGRDIPPHYDFDGSMEYRDWFCEVFQVDLATFRAIKLAFRQGGFKRWMQPYPHADALARAVRAAGAEVWITTTRPHDRFDRIDPDTREWLRRHCIEFDGILSSEHKMEELAERIDPARVCFVLDDLVETLERAERLFKPGVGVLRKTAHNRNGPRWPVTVGDLLDARAIAAAHIQDWLISHQFDALPTTEPTGE